MHKSCTVVIIIYLDLTLVTWTSEATIFLDVVPVRDERVISVKPSPANMAYSENSWQYLNSKLVKTIFVELRDWILIKLLLQTKSFGPSNGASNLPSYGDFASAICLVCFFSDHRSIPRLLLPDLQGHLVAPSKQNPFVNNPSCLGVDMGGRILRPKNFVASSNNIH